MAKFFHKRQDTLQNVIITLLTLSAVLLFTQTQLFQMGLLASDSYLHQLEGGSAATGATAASTALVAPVRASVAGDYGRFGSVSFTTADDDFVQLRNLLKGVLGSGREYTPCSETDFLQALESSVVCYDFLSPLPLSVLADLSGTEGPDQIVARHIIITPEGDVLHLYLWDNHQTYYTCQTALTTASLDEVMTAYGFSPVSLASDGTLADSAQLAPCTLLPEELPRPAVLASAAPVLDANLLLNTLQLNPRTNSRYMESDGTEVVVEGERSLRLRPDNSIYYQNGDSGVFTFDPHPGKSTLVDITGKVYALLNQLSSPFTGEAQLYLQSVHRNDSSMVLLFGYQVNGIPLQFSDDSFAASVTVADHRLTHLSLQLRQYTATEEPSVLLPLPQAVAIAAQHYYPDLFIGYADYGSDAVSAVWLSE